jgi:hypothetical protein
MPKKTGASPAVTFASASRVVSSAPSLVTPGVPGIPAPVVLEAQLEAGGLQGALPDADAIAFTEALALAAVGAQDRAARVAALVKAGIASKLADRDRLAALEKANREAVDESSEINTAIEAGIVEADRLLALQVKANKRKIAKAAAATLAATLAEAARVEALRLAEAGKGTDGESSDDVEIFVPPPPSARELALLKGSAKPLKVVAGIPSAEDIAALKEEIAQKERLKEYELLQRRSALLNGAAPSVPHETGGGRYSKCRLVYSHILLFPSWKDQARGPGGSRGQQ